MMRIMLTILLLLSARAAAAQDTRALLVDFIRMNGCVSNAAYLDNVIGIIGADAATAKSLLDEMVASGEAERSPDGAELRLGEQLCAGADTAVEEAASRFAAAGPLLFVQSSITGQLMASAACRLSLNELSKVLVSDATSEAEFEAAVASLEMEGSVTRDGETLVLNPEKCPAGKREGAPVVEFSVEHLQVWLYGYLSSIGCRYPAVGAPEFIAPDLAYALQTVAEASGYNLGPNGHELLTQRFVEILMAASEPTGWVQVDPVTGELVAVLCTP
jgi:hypothetical protein